MPKRRNWYRIQNAAKSEEATVYIYDMIDSFWGVNAQELVKELAALEASTIHVRINSPGGNVFDGMAIYNALKRHKAEIVCHVDGLAASAASVIALAGDQVLMGTGSFLMIHNAWGIAIGDANDLREMAETLEKINGSIVGVYAERTGESESKVQQWMDDETWFDVAEAIEAGFADAEEDGKKASASFELLSKYRNVPRELADSPAEPRAKVKTVRDLESLLREEGGLSHAAARAIAAHGFTAAPEPRDEDEQLAEVMAALHKRGESLVTLASR